MKLFFLFSFLLFSLVSFPQKNKKGKETFYVFDKDWKSTTVDNAVYMIYVEKKNDTTWQWNYYNYVGPLLYIETYRSEESDTAHGYFAWFNKKGKIDSCGILYKGIKHGNWQFYGDSLNPQISHSYEYGKLVKEWKSSDNVNNPKGPIPGEKEASFKNGAPGWRTYIEKNLTTPDRALKSRMGGTINIGFVILENGEVGDTRVIKSVEYSLDSEGIRVINKSPAWVSAEKDGKKVKTYHIQPMTFVITEN